VRAERYGGTVSLLADKDGVAPSDTLDLGQGVMTFCFPSTLVFKRRKMNWKFDFSPLTRDLSRRSRVSD